jgi:hypothetical protein
MKQLENNKLINDVGLAAFFVMLAITLRLIKIVPNLELVTATSIVAGIVLKNKKLSLLVPFVTMVVSDNILGNSKIFLFTWSAYIFAAVAGIIINRYKFFNLNSIFKKSLVLSGGGIIFTLFFYVWTNAGVVVVGNWYPHTVEGFLASYYNALPFLRNQLIGNAVFTPAVYFVVKYKYKLSSILNKYWAN